MQLRLMRSLPAVAILGLMVACHGPSTTASVTPPTAATPAIPPAIPPATLPDPESQAYLNGLVFDQVWGIIRDTHPDPSINQGQWNDARIQFRDRAVNAIDPDSFRTTLRDMLETLGESHFAIIPNSVSGSPGAVGGWSGITLQVIGTDVIVTQVAPKSPGESAGVKLGWALISSDGDSIAPLIQEFGPPRTSLERLARDHAIGGFIGGRAGMSPIYVFADEQSIEHTINITFDDPPGEVITMGNLPPFAAEFESNWLTPQQIESLGANATTTGRIGYLRFNVWLPALSPQIDDALTNFRTADGVIIDLRGNPGGLGLMATGVAGHFLAEPTSLGIMRGRGMKLDFRTNPRTVDRDGQSIGTFNGPLAILIDGHTGSTSEIFAAGLIDAQRAQPFGQTTAGAALPATTHTLKNGDVLLHAIGDFRTPSGKVIEGHGVVQSLGTAPSRHDYTSSPDPELRDALQWIAKLRTATLSP